MNRLACLLRFLCGGLFIIAGALKALDPAHFATDIDHYHLLPYLAVAPLALYLPWLEMICGFAVMGSGARRGALVLLLGLTIIFTIAVASAWMRGLDITCGCFGAASAVPLSFALVRNIVLDIALLWLVQRERRPASPL